MGEVYKARDTRLDRIVAIKVVSEALAASSDLRDRFEREARVIAALNHPHICTLHDHGRRARAANADARDRQLAGAPRQDSGALSRSRMPDEPIVGSNGESALCRTN
jgi:hypothetical protein